MRHVVADQTTNLTALLLEALTGTVAELRLIDAGDMITFMRTGRWANVADLVQSSSEMHFADGSLVFACSGDFAVGYSEPASVSLDMEFQHEAVTAFFTLTLAPRETRVEIRKLFFASPPESEAAGARIFAQALATTRRGGAARDAA